MGSPERNPIDDNVIMWTSKVCRILVLYKYWAIILPILGGLGNVDEDKALLKGLCLGDPFMKGWAMFRIGAFQSWFLTKEDGNWRQIRV